jgi:hypothetical protein
MCPFKIKILFKLIHKNIKFVQMNRVACDVLIQAYIVEGLSQVKHICLLKHFSFTYGENFQNPFFYPLEVCNIVIMCSHPTVQ